MSKTKQFFSVLGIIIGIIGGGTLANYFLIPTYIRMGILNPLVYGDSFRDKMILSLVICEVPWMLAMVIMFVISIFLMMGFYLWTLKD